MSIADVYYPAETPDMGGSQIAPDVPDDPVWERVKPDYLDWAKQNPARANLGAQLYQANKTGVASGENYLSQHAQGMSPGDIIAAETQPKIMEVAQQDAAAQIQKENFHSRLQGPNASPDASQAAPMGAASQAQSGMVNGYPADQSNVGGSPLDKLEQEIQGLRQPNQPQYQTPHLNATVAAIAALAAIMDPQHAVQTVLGALKGPAQDSDEKYARDQQTYVDAQHAYENQRQNAVGAYTREYQREKDTEQRKYKADEDAARLAAQGQQKAGMRLSQLNDDIRNARSISQIRDLGEQANQARVEYGLTPLEPTQYEKMYQDAHEERMQKPREQAIAQFNTWLEHRFRNVGLFSDADAKEIEDYKSALAKHWQLTDASGSPDTSGFAPTPSESTVQKQSLNQRGEQFNKTMDFKDKQLASQTAYQMAQHDLAIAKFKQAVAQQNWADAFRYSTDARNYAFKASQVYVKAAGGNDKWDKRIADAEAKIAGYTALMQTANDDNTVNGKKALQKAIDREEARRKTYQEWADAKTLPKTPDELKQFAIATGAIPQPTAQAANVPGTLTVNPQGGFSYSSGPGAPVESDGVLPHVPHSEGRGEPINPTYGAKRPSTRAEQNTPAFIAKHLKTQIELRFGKGDIDQYSGTPRNVVGTSTPSTHNFGGSLDVFKAKGRDLAKVAQWALERPEVEYVIYNRKQYYPDGTVKDYHKDPHTDHVHVQVTGAQKQATGKAMSHQKKLPSGHTYEVVK